jgi:hypothetical protein
MISFDFTPDQTASQKTLVDFSRKVLLAGYRERAASTEFPRLFNAQLVLCGERCQADLVTDDPASAPQ